MMPAPLDELLAALPATARVGIFARDLSSGREYEHHADDSFGTASVIKIAIALSLFASAEEGKIDLHKPVKLQNEDIFDIGYDDCGILKCFDGTGITPFNACALMLSMSDNTATNLLVRLLTKERVNGHLQKWGYKETRLTIDRLATDIVYAPDNYVGVSTAREMGKLLEEIARPTHISATSAEAIQKMMIAQQINHKIPRLLPSIRTLFPPHASIEWVASKTGEISAAGISNDAAIIKTADGRLLLLAIFTIGIVDEDSNRRIACIDHRSARFMADASLVIYNELMKKVS